MLAGHTRVAYSEANDALYARLLRNNPLLPELWQLRARIALRDHRYIDAIELLEQGIKYLPENIDLVFDLANAHILLKDTTSARPHLEKLLARNDTRSEYLLSYARMLWLEGLHSQAVEYFTYSLAKNSNDSRIALSLVKAYLSLDQAPKAVEILRSWRHRRPSVDMTALLALSEYDEHGIESARNILNDEMAAHLADPTLNYLQAVLLMLSGKSDLVCTYLDRVQRDERFDARWSSFLFAYRPDRIDSFHGRETALLESAIAHAPATGLVLEFGVYFGLSLRRIAKRIDGPVHGFDSFEGLPEEWKPGEPAGTYSTHGRMPSMPSQVVLHPGWFKDTLPDFVTSQTGKIRLIHIDCDLYSSTHTVLEELYPLLQIGTVLVFDEYLGFPGYTQHEFRAWHDFAKRYRIDHEYIGFTLMAKKAALRITQL
ncbi:MAG: tetratricopeptide repeat protein [Gammaproteobacteria bacterium]